MMISFDGGAGVSEEHFLDPSLVLVLPDLPDGADADEAGDDEQAAADEEGSVEGGLVEANLGFLTPLC